ncbi:transposase [Mycoplasmopsis caviae]|uniref:Transposase n=1 Tax=Mycoplasmopsis caviae TaxID=55603 RepID=A0A3P8MF55_9BACT|nr:transposase [Mycoplasmopsis caviae]UUD35596.1 transposase [Mycoplasmopsis caviae]VDR41643.1 Transposase [Mycoplasmopsis caviae]
MLYINLHVDLPEGKKIKKQNSNEFDYVIKDYETIPGKRYRRENRVLVGKVSKVDPTKMHPNDNYFSLYGEIDAVQVSEPGEHDDTISVGSVLVMQHIMNELGISRILDEIFEDKSDLIKSLPIYYVNERTSVHQHFSNWLFDNFSYLENVPSNSTISRLINQEVTSKKINEFLKLWTESLHNSSLDLNKILVSIDSTNFNVNSNKIDLSEYGKAKIDEKLRQINLAYALEQKSGLPLFYDIFPGSITDQTQCELMLQKALDYKFKDVRFVMDRGYFTGENVKYLNDNKLEFIIMARDYYSTLKKLINDNKHQITNKSKTYLEDHNCFGVKTRAKVFIDDNNEYFVYLMYSDVKASLEREIYNNKIQIFKNQLRNVKKINDGIINTYSKYFDFVVDENDNIKTIYTNDNERQRAYDNAGYYALISNVDLSVEEVLESYRNRDVIEKTFMALKSNIGFEKRHVGNVIAIESRTFLVFISTIIWSYFTNKCHTILNSSSNETVITLLNELSKIKVVKHSNTYRKKYALTTKQKEILRCFNLDENFINESIILINEIYS